ncbi:hypothetical protein P4636_00245, partial [Halalkalibacterium halodurans]|nr:hypothetical protein [Halalkalibacterium halodurans]MED4219760.1 hypothetical protein [Halalkalibacterium halodurans]
NQTATYQQYTMNQLVLPMDFSDLIPENHVARVVNDMVESLDDQLFDEVYCLSKRSAMHAFRHRLISTEPDP